MLHIRLHHLFGFNMKSNIQKCISKSMILLVGQLHLLDSHTWLVNEMECDSTNCPCCGLKLLSWESVTGLRSLVGSQVLVTATYDVTLLISICDVRQNSSPGRVFVTHSPVLCPYPSLLPPLSLSLSFYLSFGCSWSCPVISGWPCHHKEAGGEEALALPDYAAFVFLFCCFEDVGLVVQFSWLFFG